MFFLPNQAYTEEMETPRAGRLAWRTRLHMLMAGGAPV